MTPNPTNLNPTLNRNLNTPPKSPKSTPIYVRICRGGIWGRIQPRQEKENSTPPPLFYLHLPWPFCKSVSPPLPHNSRSSASNTTPHLLPAIIVLHFCRHTRPPPLPPHICWLLFFVAVVSVVVSPPPLTVGASPLLHPPCPFSCHHPPPHLTIVASPPLRMLRISHCCLPMVVAPSLSLRHHSCLSIVVCHAVCTGATLVYKNKHAGRVIIYPSIFF